MGIEFDAKKGCTISLSTLLIITVILLKVFGIINWSWWVVLLPLWLPSLIFLIFLLGIGAFIAFLYNKFIKK